VREAHEQVQWTCESDERRSGARPSATRGRDGYNLKKKGRQSCLLGRFTGLVKNLAQGGEERG